MSELENRVADLFKECGYYVMTRRNHCDVLAVKGNLAFLLECKNYSLTGKQQASAVRQLNRNYTHALELLLKLRFTINVVVKALVAESFHHQSRNILQFTYEELEDFVR